MGSDIAKKDVRDISLSGFTLSAVGVVIEGQPSLEEWQTAMQYVHRAGGAVMWWLGDLLVHGEKDYGELASQEGVDDGKYDRKTLRNAKYTAVNVHLSRRRDTLSWGHHAEVAGFSSSDQTKLLKKAEKEGWSVAAFRKVLADQKSRKLLSDNPLPDGQYHVLYADPPWRYEFSQSDSRKIENQYPTMELEDICGMEVSGIAAADSILFLWATSPKLSESLEVVDAWGFVYRTCMVWKKDKIGMGYYARQQHELLLICAKGTPPVPQEKNRPASVVEAPRTEHSKKPEVFYEIIEKLYPDTKRVELFCRSPRHGWDAWGDEVGSA